MKFSAKHLSAVLLLLHYLGIFGLILLGDTCLLTAKQSVCMFTVMFFCAYSVIVYHIMRVVYNIEF
jgi:hypothetical protein